MEHARELAEEAEIAEVRRGKSCNPSSLMQRRPSQQENAEDAVAKAALEKEQKVRTP